VLCTVTMLPARTTNHVRVIFHPYVGATGAIILNFGMCDDIAYVITDAIFYGNQFMGLGF